MTEIWSREVRTQLTERLGIFQLWTHSAQIKSYCKTTCSCFLRLVILGLYLQVAFSVGYSVLISKFLLRMDIHSVNAVEIYVHAWTPSTFVEALCKALPHTQSCFLFSLAWTLPWWVWHSMLAETLHCLVKSPTATEGSWLCNMEILCF